MVVMEKQNMMLTFRGLLVEVLDGRKTMTTRIDSINRRRIYRQFHDHSAPMYAHLWWLNPRNKSEYCGKIGEVLVRDIAMVKGKNLTQGQALLDGFGEFKDPLEQYLDALAYTNALDISVVLETVWHLYKWDFDEVEFEPTMWIVYHNEGCEKRFCPICKELEESSSFAVPG